MMSCLLMGRYLVISSPVCCAESLLADADLSSQETHYMPEMKVFCPFRLLQYDMSNTV